MGDEVARGSVFARRFLPLLAVPAVAGPLGIFGFILYSESAHDPERCPYRLIDERSVGDGGVRVREEGRRCLPEVEERRYSVIRAGATRVLGRRRFAPAVFASADYGWDAGISDAGELEMMVHNPGRPSVKFREGRPDER